MQSLSRPLSAGLSIAINPALTGLSGQSGASYRVLWSRVGWAGCGVGNRVYIAPAFALTLTVLAQYLQCQTTSC
jgi:hypothetical protein